MAGTPFRSVVTGGVQRTKQRPRGLVGLLDRSLASGTWARSSGQRVPSRMPALAGQPNVSSFQPTGNAGRYTSITSMPFLRSASATKFAEIRDNVNLFGGADHHVVELRFEHIWCRGPVFEVETVDR